MRREGIKCHKNEIKSVRLIRKQADMQLDRRTNKQANRQKYRDRYKNRDLRTD
jgi:hypothetical protein